MGSAILSELLLSFLPLMPVQGQSIKHVQYFFNQIFYAFMEFKVEVNSRSANHELTQVAYLKIPGQILKTINAGLHSDYR